MALDADRRRRSWPYPPTDLERLAESAGLDDDELRASLRRQIAERRGCDVAEVVPAEIDWGQVLDNFGPEGIAELVEQLGVSALGCYERRSPRIAPNPWEDARGGTTRRR